MASLSSNLWHGSSRKQIEHWMGQAFDKKSMIPHVPLTCTCSGILFCNTCSSTETFAAMSQIPAEVVKEVDTILANEALPVLQKVEKLFKTFSGSGFGYKQHVLPKDTLTHPSNRGGSMLNAADVWEKGHRMVKVGVQPSLLNEGAVAFELATEKGMRNRQLDANVALVKASGDTLAPVTFQARKTQGAQPYFCTKNAFKYIRIVSDCTDSPISHL